MAMQKIKKSKKLSKKSFYLVEAPLTSAKISLYGSSAEEFDGRIVKIDLTKSLRGKSLELKMKVKNDDGKLTAEPISLNLVSSYVRRNMRTGIDYVEDSFAAECRDITARVKPFLITRKKVSRAVRKVLRDEARKYIQGHVKIRDRKEVFSDIMTNKLQRGLSLKLKKVYPLALCEIRGFEVVGVKEITESDREYEGGKRRSENREEYAGENEEGGREGEDRKNENREWNKKNERVGEKVGKSERRGVNGKEKAVDEEIVVEEESEIERADDGGGYSDEGKGSADESESEVELEEKEE